MGGASAVLTRPRLAVGAVLAALVGTYYAVSPSLWEASLWWDVAFIALVLIPLVFAFVYLVLPLWTARGLLLVGLAFGLLAFLLRAADAATVANFAKLAAMTSLGFWFLSYFEAVGWVVLVALVVPWVDAYSVWRGPTKVVVTRHEHVFTLLSISFPTPGEHDAAHLGLPDLLFFALFLAASARFGLRVGWTWLALMLSFGATMAIAVGFGVGGLPALPLLSAGFLGVNADLLWKRLRPRRSEPVSSAHGP